MESAASTEMFVRLFALNQRRVYSYVLALVANPSDADDILQETSMVLWRKFSEYQPGTNFAAWACRIAYYEVLRLRRQRKLEVELPPQLFEALASETLARSDELEHRHRALSGCIEKLHAKDRELVSRRYVAGATIRSVSSQIGRSVDGLEKAYQRIRRALMDCVDRTLARECR